MNHPVWPTVGVVIPVYNDWPRLQQCLKALAGQSYPAASFRVRVVDNGSTDWPTNPQFPLPVDVIRHSQPGSYGARNCAALDWSVQVLAFTDSDCIPAPDWLEQGVRALALGCGHGRLVAGCITLEARSPQRPSIPEQLDQILGFDQARTVRRAGYGVTANLLVSQAAFQALGGFRSDTRSGGDRDFCGRATAYGLRLVYAAGAIVRHPARDWSGLLAKQRRIVGGRLSLAGASATARLRVLLLSLRPVVSESWRVLRAGELSYGRRLQLLARVVWLRAAVLLEWLRLQCPGQQSLR
jgi:glycosyltransferase involved in cell wall biosynthesis